MIVYHFALNLNVCFIIVIRHINRNKLNRNVNDVTSDRTAQIRSQLVSTIFDIHGNDLHIKIPQPPYGLPCKSVFSVIPLLA